MPLLLPRLQSRDASKLRSRFLGNPENRVFSSELLDEMYHHRQAFPATGGVRASIEVLLELRNECVTTVRSIDRNQNFEQEFDLLIGKILTDFGAESRSEFGIGAVWDFISLVLLPDIVSHRLGQMTAESSGTRSRVTGGDRRHQLQRLWRRRIVLGSEMVDSLMLTEDDYLQLLERNITLERSELTQRVARMILGSGLRGQERRLYTRTFVKSVLQMSGIVHFSENDKDHLDAAVEELHRWTLFQLNGQNRGSSFPMDGSPLDDSPLNSTPDSPAKARKK